MGVVSGKIKMTKRVRSSVSSLAFIALLVSGTALAASAPITLNLKDADINAVISTVSEVTGKNFIVDPRVKGKVTIISGRPMHKDELYQVFLSILEVHGFSAVPSGRVIKILPDATAKQSPLPIASDERPGEGDELVTRVIELSSVSAAQLVPILRPLVPQQGHLAAYAASNILIISDRAANIERLSKIIKRIDAPSSDKIEAISLHHASASDVVRILNGLEKQSGAKGPSMDQPVLIADERTNSILIGGGQSGRLRIRTIISHLDTPLATIGNTRVVYLHYARAKDLVPLLTGVSSSIEKQKGAKTQQDIPVSIQADESTNALVITSPPNMFRSLEAVIKQLDVRRAQVQVETIIAEVSENMATELGVQWAVDGSVGGQGPVGLTNFTTAGSGLGALGTALATGGAPPLESGLTLGVGLFDSSTMNFAALVRALKGDGTTNILSTPSLVTMDNEEAEIVVGQTIPFITGSYSAVGGSTTPTNPFQTIKRENVGITLKIKPQINEGDAVKLDIEQTVDSLSATPVGAADLTTTTRSIKTAVIVNDGQTIVLGGLMDNDVKESEQKVPFLGDIPLLGWLFKYKTTSNEKKNLMVFMRPIIIRDADTAIAVTSGKYNSLRNLQIEARNKGLLFMDDDRSPMLPPIDEFLLQPPLLAPVPGTAEMKPGAGQAPQTAAGTPPVNPEVSEP